MFIAYVVVAVLDAAALTFIALNDYMHAGWVIAFMRRVRVPESWLIPLATLHIAGALGLLVGISVPSIGIAAAVGLVVLFTGAIATHIRAHADAVSYAFPGTFLLLAVGSLVLRIASL
jgi:DoxX-like family